MTIEPFRLGRFTVLGYLGRGGMGSVFVAYDPDLDRKIALKVLHSTGERGRQEVLREGRALARLHHPAVVSVFEVGVIDEQVFVAMEYVAGTNLRNWLTEARTTEAILAIMTEAGRGLAAAHDGNLVHLDFKPENVLVDAAGHARVIDFGLARTIDDVAPGTATTANDAGSSSRVGGTPGYIAPERLAGVRGDPRADQYSFCVTCWEALFGARPRPDEATPSNRNGVPAHVLAALRRGMSLDPRARFASMHALLAALAASPTRRRLGALSALALAGALAGTYAMTRDEANDTPHCPSRWSQIEASWNEDRAEAVRAAFDATGLPYSRESAASVKASLDRYAGAWLALHARTCEEAVVHRIIPQEQFEQRLVCLEDRRRHLDALVERFAAADAPAVLHAGAALERLPPIEACDAVTRDQAMFAGDPAKIDERLEIRFALARGRNQLLTGRSSDADALIAATLPRAQAGDSPEVLVEALLAAAHADFVLNRVDSGLARVREALSTAVAHDDPLQAAFATVLLVQLLRIRDEPQSNDDLLALAEAFSRQAGEPMHLKISILVARANEAVSAGRDAEAAAQYEHIHALAQQHGRDQGAAIALAGLARCRDHLGDYAGAVEANRRALALFEPTFGRLHPWTGAVHLNLASVLIALEDHDAALREIERVKEIAEVNGLGDHVLVASALGNAAIIHKVQGRLDEALSDEQAGLAMEERLYGARHPQIGLTLCNMGKTLGLLGRVDEGRAAFERSGAILAETVGAGDCQALTCTAMLGSMLADANRHTEAIRVLEPLHPRSAASECPPDLAAEIGLHLARALVGAGRRDRARIKTLLDAAGGVTLDSEAREHLERLRQSVR